MFPSNQSARAIGRGSIGRICVDYPSPSPTRGLRAESSRASFASATSVAQLVEAGDAVGFEQLASGLSSAQLALALSPERTVGRIKEGSSPLMVAVKRRDLPLIRAIMNWAPEGQVRRLRIETGTQISAVLRGRDGVVRGYLFDCNCVRTVVAAVVVQPCWALSDFLLPRVGSIIRKKRTC